ncbi:TetR/AcrR family transcriptional regulator [Gordonia sp. DT30]|uniref:TetR/AcrR family transcriptional regulator n=1 Tax=unclassified Gordonia (in: high G+C Gram-positive bacteria) TaxID=2657482 RepID=UPI003CE6FF52
MPSRRRMSPEERRESLLDVGERLFGTGDFEELSMQDMAATAGVTRRLLYNHFPTKAHFFGAVWERAHTRLRTKASTTATATVRDRIETALTAYLDFYAENLPLVLTANRSSVSADPAVRGPIDRVLASLWNSFLDDAGCTGHARDLADVGFTGWIAFVRAGTLAALLDQKITPEENHELCMAALDSTVGAHVDLLVTRRH